MTGFDSERLERLRAALRADIEAGLYCGAAIVVGTDGDVAYSDAIGSYAPDRRRPITRDSVFPLMSISKSLTAVVVLHRFERGDFQLTTRVAEVIPEFGANGKGAVTVAQLLSHTSGLGDEIPPGLRPIDPDAALRQICGAPLRTPPGQFGYSGEAGYYILGELLRRSDGRGRSVAAIVDDELLRPLGMKRTSLATTPALKPERVPICLNGDTNGLYSGEQLLAMDRAFADGLEEPGGSYVATAEDLHRFAAMLLNSGRLGDARILSPAAVRLATTNHTGDDAFGVMQYGTQLVGWPSLRANYGLGFQVRGDAAFQPTFHGSLASPRAFGHRGAGLTCFWIDPDSRTSFVCLTSGFLEESRSLARWQRLSDIVHAAVTSTSD